MIFKKNPMGPVKIGDEYFDVDHKGINGVLEHLVINNHYPNKETAMKELGRLCIEIPKEMELADLSEKALSRPNSYLSRWGTANLEQVAQHIEKLDSNALARLCEKDGFKKTEKLGEYLESIKNHKRIPHIDDPKLVTELLSFYAYKVSKYREIDPALHDKIKKFELAAHRELDDKGEKSHQKNRGACGFIRVNTKADQFKMAYRALHPRCTSLCDISTKKQKSSVL